MQQHSKIFLWHRYVFLVERVTDLQNHTLYYSVQQNAPIGPNQRNRTQHGCQIAQRGNTLVFGMNVHFRLDFFMYIVSANSFKNCFQYPEFHLFLVISNYSRQSQRLKRIYQFPYLRSSRVHPFSPCTKRD